MTAIGQASTTLDPERSLPGVATRTLVAIGTVLGIIALAILPLLSPTFIHPALDATDAAARVGVSAAETHALSDASVSELVFGPGAFAFAGPDGAAFYDESERGHLRDARVLLYLALAVGLISATLIAIALARGSRRDRRVLWGAVAQGAGTSVIGVVVLGVISVVAFGTLFTLFHQIFFPGGNFTFDPRTQHLVQLYPFGFWQIAAGALGVAIGIIGTVTWLGARSLARRQDPDADEAA